MNGRWNRRGDEALWRRRPDLMDPLNPRSPLRRLKALEARIYLEVFTPHLRRLRRGARVLDAGGGPGRLAIHLRRRFQVTLFDVSGPAVRAARCHLGPGRVCSTASRRLAPRRAGCEVVQGDTASLPFQDDAFDAAFAIELLNYVERPRAVLRELARVSRGPLFLSVEAPLGALAADPRIGPADALRILKTRRFRVPGSLDTRYYTEGKFRSLLEGSGLRVLELPGTHYVTEGILDRLFDEASDAEIMRLERALRNSPLARPVARAWAAVAVKQGP